MPSFAIPGLTLIDHEITVPLVHGAPDHRTLTVFAREVRLPGDSEDKPCLLFLQGGPGGESPRPTGLPMGPAWLARALQDYRVILLDQRGTGRSSALTRMPDVAATELAEYLTHFRADAIVQDAELLRVALGQEQWSLLGQSFGGFCSLHYLSRFPERLREVYFTGGLPPIGRPVDEVYAASYLKTMQLTEAHYARFPGDRDAVREIVRRCDAGEILLPGGQPLSSRQFRSVGHHLGMNGGSEALHFLLERDPLSLTFSHAVAGMLPYGGGAPLYTILHESSYADGCSTRWSSQRTRPAVYDEDVTLLTAEHPFPWHLDEDPDLAPFRETADLLADVEWPTLYDEKVLRSVEVPCAAAIYWDDPYVLASYSLETTAIIPTMRPWITSDYLHNGLRVAGDKVLDRLITLARGGA